MAAQVHGDLSASRRGEGNRRRHGAADAAGRGPKPHGSDRLSTASCGDLTNPLGAGWGGRDRTSEWRNQNPLPYRLATPQQATNGTAEELVTADSLQSQPVYRERRGISTAWRAKYHRLRRLGRGTLCCWPDDRPVPATAGRPDS